MGALPHTHTGRHATQCKQYNLQMQAEQQSIGATATLPVTQLSFGRERVQARHSLVRCCCLRCVYPSLTSSSFSSSLTSRCLCVYVCARLRLSVRCFCCCFFCIFCCCIFLAMVNKIFVRKFCTANIYMYIYICTYIYKYIPKNTYTHIHTCVCMYVCIEKFLIFNKKSSCAH